MLTGKPILFYVPDAENFEDYRGLYFGFDKLPGPAVSTPEKLGELLKDLPGVAVSCKEKYEKQENRYVREMMESMQTYSRSPA